MISGTRTEPILRKSRLEIANHLKMFNFLMSDLIPQDFYFTAGIIWRQFGDKYQLGIQFHCWVDNDNRLQKIAEALTANGIKTRIDLGLTKARIEILETDVPEFSTIDVRDLRQKLELALEPIEAAAKKQQADYDNFAAQIAADEANAANETFENVYDHVNEYEQPEVGYFERYKWPLLIIATILTGGLVGLIYGIYHCVNQSAAMPDIGGQAKIDLSTSMISKAGVLATRIQQNDVVTETKTNDTVFSRAIFAPAPDGRGSLVKSGSNNDDSQFLATPRMK